MQNLSKQVLNFSVTHTWIILNEGRNEYYLGSVSGGKENDSDGQSSHSLILCAAISFSLLYGSLGASQNLCQSRTCPWVSLLTEQVMWEKAQELVASIVFPLCVVNALPRRNISVFQKA